MEEKLIRLFAFEDIVCKICLKDFLLETRQIFCASSRAFARSWYLYALAREKICSDNPRAS